MLMLMLLLLLLLLLLWMQSIDPDVMFPTLCRQLAMLGAQRLLDPVLRSYPEFVAAAREQPLQLPPDIPRAPKLQRQDSVVQWNVWSANEVYNRYRALTPDPGLCTFLRHHSRPNTILLVKLLEIVSPHKMPSPPSPPSSSSSSSTSSTSSIQSNSFSLSPGQVVFQAPYLWVWTASNSWLAINKLQVSSGRPLNAVEFWHGYHPTTFLSKPIDNNKIVS
jgi:methionyl-tRNA formyltransferase